ncbi:hypothetical protein [Ilumatobacter sp.]|uniref:hypothetical protein n=1 Tax=Ilumatobacter sp. TaxID=1967498 RepID=UPI003B5168AC
MTPDTTSTGRADGDALPGEPGRWTRRRLLVAGGVVAGSAIAAGASPGPVVAAPTGPIVDPVPVRPLARATRVSPPPAPGGYDPDVRYVGIYGFPGTPVLGALGEQPVELAVERARAVAAPYDAFDRPAVATFEILASVAAADAGADGDYSNEFDPSTFDPWVRAAAANDMAVIFDLQSGRSRFPDQARRYEDLWLHPHTHLALDPEWRVDSGAPGGGRVGTVDAVEVNETIAYLDALVTERGLPPKMLVLHQFRASMVTNKAAIRQTANVRVVMHMDGFGSLSLKRRSYDVMVADLPPGAVTGWKNFFDEDQPTPTPAETVADDPSPILVTYQ